MSVAKVVLKKGKTQLFKDGSPMVYSGAVDRIVGRPPPTTGDIVLVTDETEKPIGWGLYNSVSMFCVRLMQLEDEAAKDPSCVLNVDRLLESRISSAVELRRQLRLPSAQTNAYCLVNSEGDRLSGLIVDIFGDEAVVVSSAAWVEKYNQQIRDCISKTNHVNHITWRPSIDILKEEGLDVCCYTAGFALNAARGGALSVTGVDSSSPALEIARENVVLNNLDPRVISFQKEDATHFMKTAIANGDSWDIVILDPPKLAPSRKALQNALGAASMAGRKIKVVCQAGAGCAHPIDPSYPEGEYLLNVLLNDNSEPYFFSSRN
ncbi:hypothetical protein SASPL_146682 [Salvia splendens]|uniref:PUA domain-containing protein n=1 Tax=Salvia splendens TaxID=180675 RepID=A0A8X8WDS0_SALSN|nr:hypothetical protein SASPL_146682 [Salvia splendens]